MSKTILAAILFVALAACGSKKSKDEPAPVGSAGSGSAVAVETGSGSAGSGSAVVAGTGSGSAGSAAEPVDVPTEADYETEADKEITEANVAAKLTELEKDLAE